MQINRTNSEKKKKKKTEVKGIVQFPELKKGKTMWRGLFGGGWGAKMSSADNGMPTLSAEELHLDRHSLGPLGKREEKNERDWR